MTKQNERANVNEGMRYWHKVSRPPTEALKQIGGGRLRGMTDINPQWRMEILTEVFGPCGSGWKFEIEKVWTEEGNDNVVCVFAIVGLYFKEDGEWSEKVPGIGGSTLVAKESSGLYTNDEAYKMAVTDAFSVAAKALGVASEIYRGHWDGSKYKIPREDPKSVDFKTADAASQLKRDIERAADGGTESFREAWKKADKNLLQIIQDNQTDWVEILKGKASLGDGNKKIDDKIAAEDSTPLTPT